MRAREWCKLPYGRYTTKTGLVRYTHPNGCPNYNKPNHPECPPRAPLIHDFFDLSKDHWFIVVDFDLGSHTERMKLRPRKSGKDWTEKQARCNRLWQKSVVKVLRLACEKFCSNKGLEFRLQHLIPEGMGVNVVKTAKNIGIPIKTRPKDTVYKIALIGYPKHPANKNIKKLFRKKRKGCKL